MERSCQRRPHVGSDSTASICRVRRHRFCRLFSADRWCRHVERSCAPHRWRISGYVAAQAEELTGCPGKFCCFLERRAQFVLIAKNSSTQERKNAAMRTSARELLVLLEFSSSEFFYFKPLPSLPGKIRRLSSAANRRTRVVRPSAQANPQPGERVCIIVPRSATPTGPPIWRV